MRISLAPYVLSILPLAVAFPAWACPAVPMPTLAPGAETLSLEGPLQTIDTTAREITVIGSCVVIPAGLLIDTSGDGTGDITLDQMVDASLPSTLGGTIILDASVSADSAGNAVFTATNVYFEFGEHVIVGPLLSVDAANGTFVAGHTLVHMNTDPRLPSIVADLGGNPISVDDMVGFEGTLVGVNGYQAGANYFATFVETSVVQTVEGQDSVVVERADWRASKRSVDVRGAVGPHSATGQFAATVDIDVSCNGTVDNVATVTVDPVLNLGEYRWTSPNNLFPTNPGDVCVISPNGGTAQRTFDVR